MPKPDEGQGPQIMIELTGPNSINLVAPINDKLLCFGMLEMAKMAIEEHHRELRLQALLAEKSGGIVPPTDEEIAKTLADQRKNDS